MRLIPIISALLLLSSAARSQEPCSFPAADGVLIHADWYSATSSTERVLVLLHMNGHDRSDWKTFAPLAAENGFSVLALDLRGHGESILKSGDTLEIAELSHADYAAMTLDVDAALGWIRQSLGRLPAVGVIGASLGANLALKYAAAHPEILAVALISPGLDYRGLDAEAALAAYQPRPALLIAANDDNYSAVSVLRLMSEGYANADQQLYESGGHGAYLFEAHADLPARLLDYMKFHLN